MQFTKSDSSPTELKSRRSPEDPDDNPKSWTEKALGVYVNSVRCGAKTKHLVSKKPEYKIGDIVTFFCYQNGTHPAVTVLITRIDQQRSYLDAVRKHGGELVPYAAKRKDTNGKHIKAYQRNHNVISEYEEYRWLMTARRINTNQRAMTATEFKNAKPWLVSFEKLDVNKLSTLLIK